MPDELDPQIREFTSQLRRVVDRSGLSVASVSDRTGYSKTSWERYLNGRLLAPKGAIVALAEVTGTNPTHLTTMWELAERAWSRSEMRHDMTMEAIRISQARAALSELAGPSSGAGGRARKGGAAVRPGVAGPAGAGPGVPPQPTASEVRDASGGVREDGVPGGSPGTDPWGVAGPSRPGRRGTGTGAVPPAGGGPARGEYGAPPREPAGHGRSGGSGGRRRTSRFVVGAVGALVVIAAAFYVTGTQDDGNDGARTSPSPTATTEAKLPPGVKCSGDGCDGKDAEVMGCSGELVTTTRTATVGAATVEIRYSETCGAAWGRITQAAQGDRVEITTGTSTQSDTITAAGDTVTYTPMVPADGRTEVRACAVLAASGEKGCTE
ncbi:MULTISPECIES: DUF2690 domain-containing protein [unclassified Streptomyces]|uniref:helix-turn-helix domain-containing protein n=1 Tax=unclassified Streptomyces TaxID=2593676 RepID=UPI003702CE01